MAIWRIGFDETGSFNHLDPDDESFVCAVVTKKKNTELLENFVRVCKKWYKGVDYNKKEAVLEKFHGCMQGRDRNSILKDLLEDETFFVRVIRSKGRPNVSVNPQQWWISAIFGVINEFFSPQNPQKNNEIRVEKGDKIEIEIANRDALCLGMLGSSHSKKLWNRYNEVLSDSINSELQKKHSGYTIRVKLCAAGKNELPTLADQVTNMLKPEFQNHISDKMGGIYELVKNPETASPSNFSLGRDADSYLENGDRLGAVEILLSQIFSGVYRSDNGECVKKLGEILDKPDSHTTDFKIWSLIVSSVETTLSNRGSDGNATNHVAAIIPVLLDRFSKKITDSSLLHRFLKTYGDFVGDAGLIRDERMLFPKIKQKLRDGSLSFNSKYEKWSFYVKLLADEAELNSNAYNFDVHELDEIIKVQDEINAVQYPADYFQMEQPDDVSSRVYGELGQREAFYGHYEKAIELLEKDYCYSTDFYKNMPASFLTVVYHRQKNIEKAREWLGKQKSHIENKSDQWLVLNELRVRALEFELNLANVESKGIEDDIQFWRPRQNKEGDYPWSLLLKWRAFIMHKKGNEPIENLKQAYKKLTESKGFTIRTLALSVMAMLIAIHNEKGNAENLELCQKEYEQLLKKCCDETPSFKDYVRHHIEFEKAPKASLTLWEAATLLPFNYS